MLVLSRKKGDSVIIAGNIRITVIEVRHGKVRLGIEAPESVSIFREEISPIQFVKEETEPEEDASDLRW